MGQTAAVLDAIDAFTAGLVPSDDGRPPHSG
jgi:hypothetical protein